MAQEKTQTEVDTARKHLKLLFVGNSFAVDSTWHVADIARSLGFETVKIGTLFVGGCSINMQCNYIENDMPVYRYYTNDGTGWTSVENYKVADAAKSDEWDWVLFIGGTKDGSRNTDPAAYQNLPKLMGYLRVLVGDKPKFAFVMTWMGEPYDKHPELRSYGGDHKQMYEKLVEQMQNTVLVIDGMDRIVPTGTAIQNARTARHEVFTRDGYHLSYTTGRFIAGLTLFKTLTGEDIDHIAWMPEGMDEYSKQVALEAVNHAIECPFEVTPSVFTEVKFKCDRLFREVDALYKRYLKVWEDVCCIESPTDHKEGVDAVGNYFAELAEKRGWQVERLEQEIYGDVLCLTMNPDASLPSISLSGHMDTVHPIGFFGEAPVSSDEERIYGPGVTDCKGGIVAGFMAMEALRRMGYNERPIRLLLQSNEEVGSIISDHSTTTYLCEKSKDCVAFLNLEPATAGEVCIERKGIITFTFTVRGQEAHSSLCAKMGANAIADAAHKIIQIEKWKDDEGITCNVGKIEGGSAPNTVPGSCRFLVNVRFATAEQSEEICRFMQALADTVHVPGCVCNVERSNGRVAGELVERNITLLAKMNRIFAENALSELKAVKERGGSDASDVTAYGIPCVDGLGVEGGAIHSREEYAIKTSLKDAAKRLAAIIYCM